MVPLPIEVTVPSGNVFLQLLNMFTYLQLNMPTPRPHAHVCYPGIQEAEL